MINQNNYLETCESCGCRCYDTDDSDNKFYQDIDVKEDLTAVYKSLKEKVYSLNVLQKKLYTLLYSKQKEFTE